MLFYLTSASCHIPLGQIIHYVVKQKHGFLYGIYLALAILGNRFRSVPEKTQYVYDDVEATGAVFVR